jgi:general secretion pathway protein G
MNMNRKRRSAFSLLEIIAAVVILAVVAAATVATVAPMRAKSAQQLDLQDQASLTAMAQTYFVEVGRYPTSIAQLATQGYIGRTTPQERTRLQKLSTTWRIDPTTGNAVAR